MPTLFTACSRFCFRLAPLAFALVFVSPAGSTASAQEVGWPQSYSVRWYGQNFYDHQGNGVIDRVIHHRQYSGGYYGPAMLYGRQYGDQFGNIRDVARDPLDRGYWNGFHSSR